MDTRELKRLGPAIGLLVIMAIVGGWWLKPIARVTLPIPKEPVPMAHIRGRVDAKVGILVFADFQCPFCSDLALKVLPPVIDDYVATGKTAIGFRHYPLSIHAQAQSLAVFAECLSEKLDFWDVHDRLFRFADQTDEVRRWRLFSDRNVDEKAMQQCITDRGVRKVTADLGMARSLGLNGTPVVLVGELEQGALRVTRVFDGIPKDSGLRHAIDAILGRVFP